MIHFLRGKIVHNFSISSSFDIALDVGCLHGLGAAEQQRYALELTRLMAPGGTLLVWVVCCAFFIVVS